MIDWRPLRKPPPFRASVLPGRRWSAAVRLHVRVYCYYRARSFPCAGRPLCRRGGDELEFLLDARGDGGVI